MKKTMRKNGFDRIMALALTAGLTLSQPVAAMDSGIPAENEAVTATALSVEGDTAASNLSGKNDSGADSGITAAGGTDTSALSVIHNPVKGEGYSTWDCIWFGNYWQEDTNNDGYCFERDTTVTKHEADDSHLKEYYTDQDGKELYGFEGEAKKYSADKKQPIKWRVLDIDESGNALLLADKLIDIVKYNETYTDVTWETCTMRSYLNGYDGSNNDCNKDFSGDKSFIHNAFSEAERDSIIISDLKNPDNPVFETKGGDNTQDKIFCLSLDEARKADYGFVKNEFTYGEPKPFYTDDDPTRVAVTTKFTEDKPDYNACSAGTSDWWWLRSPGSNDISASDVGGDGAAYASSGYVGDTGHCARPAFRMNLSSSSSLWTYAGTVGSDGTVVELVAVAGISLSENAMVYVGKTITLTPDITPSNATDKTITWKSSAESVATVSDGGVVTGVTEGTADITVTTNDGGYTAVCLVTVKKPEPDTISVNGVTLPATGSVKVGKTITLTPEISPSDATDKTVTWKSSAEGVATVSTEGVVTGITEGTADITVTTNDGGFTATCRVTVSDPGPDPSEEDLKKDIDVDSADQNFDMLPGEVRRLKINKTGKYVYGVSYVSDDPKTVSVKNGVVTAKNLKKGETEKKVTVTATYNGESVLFVITVKAGVPDVSVGQKGSKISAPKTVKADVGTLKAVTATVKLPKALQGKAVKPDKTDCGFFTLEETAPDPKGTKASFKITPKEAGAAYVVWTVTDDSGNKSQAYTKVLIKKPLSVISVNGLENSLDLAVGEGQRLIVTTTKGNTDPKDLSFSVKGKGVKVSKSGFVTAITPGAEADVTIKAGKNQKTVTVRVKDHTGSILALNKTSVNVKRPKEGAKPKTAALKVTMPKKNPPEVKWSIANSPKGIAVDPDGKVTVTSDASPGCYTVTATPKETSSGYNPVCCELIVR